MKQPIEKLSSTVSRIGLVLALASVFLLGMVGIAGATNPATAPIIHATYQVNKDADSGYNGFWAMDNFTAQLTVWQTGPNTYEVNVTDTGLWCTFAGSPTPGVPPQVVQAAPECGSIEGGYDGNLTTVIAPANTSQTTLFGSPFNGGATVSPDGLITPGAGFSGQFNWIGYFFPGATSADFAFANNGNGWNWTYIAPSGNKWIDSGPDAGSLSTDGQINTALLGSVVASSDIIPSVCALGATGGVNFGDVTPGAGQVVSVQPAVTVTDEGNAATGVGIYGSDWSNNAGSVGWTQYNIGSSLNVFAPSYASLTYTPVTVPGSPLAAYGGSEPFSFGLTVPGSASGGQHTQTITFVSSC